MGQPSTSPSEGLPYRPEIDGLRAIAVLAVFAFHLNRDLLPGGFVGVDVFFVISGYLITAILYRECVRGQFCVARFYQRRIARIFPAFFAVALVTLAGASIVYSAQDYASAGANLVAASLSVANIKYMLQGSYFEISPDAQPYLHYWSLSVEEQFYLIYPLVLFFLFRLRGQYLVRGLEVLVVVSLTACIVLTAIKPVWAFYLLPTRAWELGVGGLLAVVAQVSKAAPVFGSKWLPITGLLILSGCFLLLSEGPSFPGWQAILPVLGAAAIIASDFSRGSWAATFLTSGIMTQIGKLSYSLYLWHWPVFSLTDYELFAAPAEVRLVLKVVLSLVLAIATFYLVERPARNYLNAPQRRFHSFGSVLILIALCVTLGANIRHANYIDAELSDVSTGGRVIYGTPGRPTVVLMGDSNGSMYGKLVKEICAEVCGELRVISVSAGDPLPTGVGDGTELWRSSLEVIERVRPDYLILAIDWMGKLGREPERLTAALAAVRPYVGHVVLLNQPPLLPREVGRSYIRRGGSLPIHEESMIRARRQRINELLRDHMSPTVSVVDVSRYFESEDGHIILFDERGRFLYQDAAHLSEYGAQRIRGALNDAIRLQ